MEKWGSEKKKGNENVQESRLKGAGRLDFSHMRSVHGESGLKEPDEVHAALVRKDYEK